MDEGAHAYGAGGFAELCFSCVDGAGHAALDIALTSDWPSEELEETAKFRIQISAAAVDQLVQQLQSLRVESEFTAHP